MVRLGSGVIDEGLLRTDQQVSVVVVLRPTTVHHVPVIANQHPLLEERRVWTRVTELPSEPVAHMIQLKPMDRLNYSSNHYQHLSRRKDDSESKINLPDIPMLHLHNIQKPFRYRRSLGFTGLAHILPIFGKICKPKTHFFLIRFYLPMRRHLLDGEFLIEGTIDGAPPHFALPLRHYLHENFPHRWMGRGSEFVWPPRSPDLNPLNFSVWSNFKDLVYQEDVNYLENTVSVTMSIVATSADCTTPSSTSPMAPKKYLWREEWPNLIFSDESRFCLYRHDGWARIPRRQGKRKNHQFIMARHTAPTQGIMVWGAIGYNNRSRLFGFK
ncbi:hypothetical protein NQ318_020982, partial [Aromia moschata]